MTRTRIVLLLVVLIALLSGLLAIRQRSQASTLTVDQTARTVSLAADQAQYSPGQPIILTVRNLGRQTVTLAYDPPYSIWSDEQIIYQPVRAISTASQPAHTLGPGESASWQWDQFTITGQVDPGQYRATMTTNSGKIETELGVVFEIRQS